jgi:hypothetical protein
MKQSVVEALAEKGLPNYGNRRPHLNCSHNLCTCGDTKRSHFNGAKGHNFKSGDQKNVSSEPIQAVVKANETISLA